MSSEQFNTIHDELKAVFENVCHWLEFAEAKNAALIAFNIAVVAAIMTLNSISTISALLILLCLSSVFVSILSFLPNVNLPDISRSPHSNNLLYYSDIAQYSPEKYLADFATKYYQIEIQLSKNLLLDDYASEIVANSRIAVKKYRCFTIAAWLDILAVLIFALDLF